MKICTKIVVLWLSTNIIKAANNISIPANKIKIHILDNDEMWSTDDTTNIIFSYGTLRFQLLKYYNKYKRGDKTINEEVFNGYCQLQTQIDNSIYTGTKTFKQEDVNDKEITFHVCKYKPVDANNIQIKIDEKTFTNIDKIDNIYDSNFFESYSQKSTGNEVAFLKFFKVKSGFKFNGSDLYFEMKGDNYCVKSYSCGSTNLDFSKREPSLDERKKMLDDIKDNKKVTLTVVKCKNRINFIYIEGKEFDKVNKKYQQIIDIIEKYRSGRYDNDNITFKAIVDEIKALSIYPGGEISIVEKNNEGKEYNSDNNPINFNATWLITLPEICYKKDIKLNVKFISEDNNFELVKRIQNFENLEIDAIEGYTLLNLKNTLCSILKLTDEFKENDGLTYNYESNNTALKDTEVFNENKTIEIHIPNTKTNLVTKKETEDKDKDKDNSNNNIGDGNGNGNKEVKKGGPCCNYTKK